jgi:hypothetical protein
LSTAPLRQHRTQIIKGMWVNTCGCIGGRSQSKYTRLKRSTGASTCSSLLFKATSCPSHQSKSLPSGFFRSRIYAAAQRHIPSPKLTSTSSIITQLTTSQLGLQKRHSPVAVKQNGTEARGFSTSEDPCTVYVVFCKKNVKDIQFGLVLKISRDAEGFTVEDELEPLCPGIARHRHSRANATEIPA